MYWAEHTNFHARTQHPYRIILKRDFTLLRTHTHPVTAQLSNADFYRNHKTGNVQGAYKLSEDFVTP
jgi:hypothetical protein